MILILLGLLLGLLVGWLLPFQIPVVASRYVSVAFLAGLDSVLGGTRAGLEKDFDFGVFAGGFLINLFLAGLLTWIGDILGVEIYVAALVTFGMRIFVDLGHIRRDLLGRGHGKSTLEDVINPKNSFGQ
ncbi:MAG: small basic family protein [bacterium]|nr:small basic family protein [bacterium]